jgi:hypothetical protein
LITIVGGDISFAHFAFVQVQIDETADNPIATATPINWWFLTEKAYIAKKTHTQGHGYGFRLPKIADPEIRKMMRMDILARCTYQSGRGMTHASIEGFALGATQRNPYELGGVGYLTRRGWWRMGINYRFYAPTQLKKFVCHRGGGWPKGMAKIVSMEKSGERWPDAVAKFDRFQEKNSWGTTYEDLVDAFDVGVLGLTELMLRSGYMHMSDLSHDKEREIFNETSKYEPENLLIRPWTGKPDNYGEIFGG